MRRLWNLEDGLGGAAGRCDAATKERIHGDAGMSTTEPATVPPLTSAADGVTLPTLYTGKDFDPIDRVRHRRMPRVVTGS